MKIPLLLLFIQKGITTTDLITHLVCCVCFVGTLTKVCNQV